MDKHMAERLARAAYNINVVQKRINEEVYETKILPEIKQIISKLYKKYDTIEINYKIGRINQEKYCQALVDLKKEIVLNYDNIKLKCRDVNKIAIFDSRFVILTEKIDIALSCVNESHKF